MDWLLTFKLIVGFLLAIGAVGGVAVLLAWLWAWSTDPRDVDAYWDPARFDA